MGGSPHPPPVGKTLPDTDWTTLDGGLNKTFYYKDNIHLLKNGNKKLALSIKTKLDNIKINFHEIAINEWYQQ